MKSIFHVTVKFFGENVRLEIQHVEYTNGRTALIALDDEGERFGTITVNVPEADLDDDEIIVKMYSENAEWVPQVMAALPGVFHETGRKVRTGYVESPVYLFTPDFASEAETEEPQEA